MTPLYDADGEEIEGALSPEEAKALQERAAELEGRAQKAVELEEALKQKEEELVKLSNKDYNFKRLRDKSEQEVEDMKKKMSEKEQMLLTEVVELTKERDLEKQARFNEVRENVLKSLSGDDEGLRKSIEAAEKELKGEALTPKELEERYRKAYILAKGVMPVRNPIYSGYVSSYSEPETGKRDFTETEEGKESLKAWFPEIAGKIINKS
jgi:DNA repair exonuclease SbcCD ATPase subunit